jgi:uncharacterized membrane protein
VATSSMAAAHLPTRFRVGAALLGVGFGGLADGIVFHQVLQWHNFVAEPIPPDTLEALRTNVFWDGVFHVATTLVLRLGLVMLQRSWDRNERAPGDGRAVLGWALIGWRTFNLVDQLVLHELLDLHDIRMGVPNGGVQLDLRASGLLLIGLGVLALRRWQATTERSSP